MIDQAGGQHPPPLPLRMYIYGTCIKMTDLHDGAFKIHSSRQTPCEDECTLIMDANYVRKCICAE